MPFSQANSSISRKYGGTGLGLAICKRLIETMGGGISISSKEGEGSTFFFTLNLPMGEETHDEQGGAVISQETVSYQRPLNILVVDDNGINQKVIVGFLNKHRVSSLTASNGEEALNLVAQNNFDLILMDIELPDMSGVEVTEKIRALPLPHKAQIPIAALTGNIGSQDLHNYQDVGMNDFAPKPITMEKISELLLKADGQIEFPWNKNLIADLTGATAEEPSAEELEWDAMIASQGESDPVSEANSLSERAGEPTTAESEDLAQDNEPILRDDTLVNFDFGDFGDLGDEDEDSFALAVKQFEEQEKQVGLAQTQ